VVAREDLDIRVHAGKRRKLGGPFSIAATAAQDQLLAQSTQNCEDCEVFIRPE
jgi:hypothetical protein